MNDALGGARRWCGPPLPREPPPADTFVSCTAPQHHGPLQDSKLCNMMFMAEASRRLAEQKISVNAFSPGLIADPNGFFRNQVLRCATRCNRAAVWRCGGVTAPSATRWPPRSGRPKSARWRAASPPQARRVTRRTAGETRRTTAGAPVAVPAAFFSCVSARPSLAAEQSLRHHLQRHHEARRRRRVERIRRRRSRLHGGRPGPRRRYWRLVCEATLPLTSGPPAGPNSCRPTLLSGPSPAAPHAWWLSSLSPAAPERSPPVSPTAAMPAGLFEHAPPSFSLSSRLSFVRAGVRRRSIGAPLSPRPCSHPRPQLSGTTRCLPASTSWRCTRRRQRRASWTSSVGSGNCRRSS